MKTNRPWLVCDAHMTQPSQHSRVRDRSRKIGAEITYTEMWQCDQCGQQRVWGNWGWRPPAGHPARRGDEI